ncbi:MAG TPA: methyltransferase domain-containing protein [Thermoleophilaceae bacterium]|nr:methyltransferase domain-containing protein [Thermoleophilaceae bacterium]
MTVHELGASVRAWWTRLWFERRFGSHTEGPVDLESLGVAEAGRWRYEPSPWHVLRRVLPKREVGPDDVFLDMGSGMGRVLLQAADYRPRRVIGVEVSEELNRIARENLDRNRARLKCDDFEVVTADACEYAVPDDVTIVFLNNPFIDEVFERAIARVVDSLDRRPRRLRIAYRHPLEHDALMATGRFELVRRWQRGQWRGRPRGTAIHLYEALAPSEVAVGGGPGEAGQGQRGPVPEQGDRPLAE